VYAASTSNFEQEWSKLVAAAQKEGRLVIAAGGQPSRQYRPVLEIFQKKFGVKAELSTGGANDTVNRVAAERKAGKYSFDVILISVRINNLRLIPLGALAPVPPLLIHPEVVNTANWYGKKHWYGDKDLKHTFLYHASVEDNYDMWYNTEKIKEADIKTIKDQWDFFDARWKGKIQGQGMGDPSGIRQMIDAWYEPERGPKWVKTYLTEAGVTFAEDRRLLESWLVSGRFPLRAVSSSDIELRLLAKKGIPIKLRPLPRDQGVLRATGSGCCISVFDNAPHPNAAKLFVNWFLSKEGQTLTHQLIPALDRASLRTDVPWGEVLEEQRRDNSKKYLFPDADPDSGAQYEKAQAEIMKIWETRQK
jgi:iron(III) transport system substrate-binding protein